MPSFAQLNLNSSLLQTLHHIGHKEATPIQLQAIPRIMAGKDVIATAQTGTGKTAAYLLPAFEMLINNPRQKNHPRILVLTPTRELAFQVKDAAMSYGRHLRPEIASILGGMPYNAQLRQLAKPLDIIVATPGRLIDHLEQKRLNLSAIEMLVIDEADRMLDMGFSDDVIKIVKTLPKTRQTLLFTATIDKHVTNLANTILNKPERIEVLGKQVTLENIEQRLYIADDHAHKDKLLQHILANECVQKAIVFCATKRDTDSLAKHLRADGHNVGTLHGDMKQQQRNKTIMQLRTGKIYLLVATDVAARGIDINDISHVINYDLPKVAEDYVHRIGRTGRAGKSGIAISLASGKDGALLKQIEKFTQHVIKQQNIPGLESKRGLTSDKNKTKHRSRGNSSHHSKKFSDNKSHSTAKRSRGDQDRFSKSSTEHSRFGRSEKTYKSGNSTRSDRFEKSDGSYRSDNRSKPSHFEKSDRTPSRSSRYAKSENTFSPSNTPRYSRFDKSDRAPSRFSRNEKSDNSFSSHDSPRHSRFDKSDRPTSRTSRYGKSEDSFRSSDTPRHSRSDNSDRPTRNSRYDKTENSFKSSDSPRHSRFDKSQDSHRIPNKSRFSDNSKSAGFSGSDKSLRPSRFSKSGVKFSTTRTSTPVKKKRKED